MTKQQMYKNRRIAISKIHQRSGNMISNVVETEDFKIDHHDMEMLLSMILYSFREIATEEIVEILSKATDKMKNDLELEGL